MKYVSESESDTYKIAADFAATLSGWPLRLTMQTARGGDDPRRGMVADAQIHARMAHGTLAETGNATRNS